MRKMKVEQITKEVVDDIFCNKCGNSLKVDIQDNLFDFYGLTNVEIWGGYFSPVLADMSEYHFDLCEKCVAELMNSFKIPALITEDE